MIYKTLFNLRIGHNYYKSNIAKGVYVAPVPSTAALLENVKMLFRVTPAGSLVLYQGLDNETAPLVDIGKDAKFTFYLRPENPHEFFNITNLDVSPSEKFRSGNIVHFKNNPASASSSGANPEILTHNIIDSLRYPLFSYEFSLTPAPLRVIMKVTDEKGSLISIGKFGDGIEFPVALTLARGSDNTYRQQIDLRGKPEGKYVITIRNTDDTTTLMQTTVYVNSELVHQDILGIVDIVYDASSDHIYGDTEHYLLQFTRKETIWRYLIADKNGKVDLDANDLFITDTGSGENPYDVCSFTREGSEPHADIRLNGFDTVVFKSDVPIPFYEVPRLNLELRKNPGDQQVIANLPNPSHSGTVKELSGVPASEIYLFI